MGVDGGAGAPRLLPAVLEGVLEVVAHPVRGVRVQAAHAGHLVTQALLSEDLRDAIFGHKHRAASPGSPIKY
jgi:hypothetical protein